MPAPTTSRRAAVVAALAFGAAAVAGLLAYRGNGEQGQKRFARDTLDIVTAGGTRTLDIEVAVSPSEQAQGLMFRTELADTAGMLFLHPVAGEIRMWMRNTYIPLDMVFIRADGTVHRIAERTEPMSEEVIPSNGSVAAVLEIAGGAAQRLGIKPGDTVRHAHFGTAQRH